MKYLVLAFACLVTLSHPALAGEGDSTVKKAAKLKVIKELGHDSLLKKGAQLEMAREVTKEKDDSTLKKATKLKVLKEATKNA